jgi:hypothetical protein
MLKRRSLERIINQLALLHVDGIRGCHPCLVENFHGDGAMLHSSTHHTAAFKFDLSLMASKRQSIVGWCGGTEIPAASNLSIKARLAQRARLDREGDATRRRPIRLKPKIAAPKTFPAVPRVHPLH